MIDQVSRILCTGCRACEAVCPHRAITFVLGEDRFLYPEAGERCTSCGLCLSVCPVLNESAPIDRDEISLIAARNRNEEVLKSSSSGGVFFELAKTVIEYHGVVFGAAWNAAFRLNHRAVESLKELPTLMGSKYVQSDIGDCYRQAKRYLDEGREVLFSGTPCQIRGLRAYLRKEYDRLYTVDLVCHGVPSQDSFDRYIAAEQRKVGSPLAQVDFRNKSSGWRDFSVRLSFENGTVVTNQVRDDLFMRAFLKNLTLRSSCYDCRANKYRSGSDITLGDFWNIEKISETYTDDRGVSGVMLKTKKGHQLFARLKNDFMCETHEVDSFVKYNAVVETSVQQPTTRDVYLKQLQTRSFERLDSRFVCSSHKERVKKLIKKLTGR